MERSEQNNELFAALAKAQGTYDAATKDRENPHFKSSYATLASGWNAARKALSANGLAVVQSVQTEESGVQVETLLGHASGQWLSSTLFVPAVKFDAQGLGSASTYARRYALFAILGIAPEDDDGEEATKGMEGKNDSPPARAPRKSSSNGEPARIPYGDHKGKTVDDPSVPHGFLADFMEPALAKSINDPAKSRFKASNEQLLKAVRAELARREAAFPKHDAPAGDNGWDLDNDAREAAAEAFHAQHD